MQSKKEISANIAKFQTSIMCGRFTLFADLHEIAEELRSDVTSGIEIKLRYNIAPGQSTPVIIDEGDGARAVPMKWGLIQSWAKDPNIGSKMINARAETVAEKFSYRAALKKRRRLVPTNGFYEWQTLPSKKKQPLFISLETHKLFAMDGLWESWKNSDGLSIKTFTLFTVPAIYPLSIFHDRMPAAFFGEQKIKWLKGRLQPEGILKNLSENTHVSYNITPISTAVNNPANDYPELLAPID